LKRSSYRLFGLDHQDGGLICGELSTDEQVCASGDHHRAECHAGYDCTELLGKDFDLVLASGQGGCKALFEGEVVDVGQDSAIFVDGDVDRQVLGQTQ
jgi:hypothetical protein